ncbi:MAG: hypothetical protein U1E65_23025 [Myxococcota bacterium]
MAKSFILTKESRFLTDAAKAAATATVKAIESRTSAEIVIALRKDSATPRQADYLGGFILSFGFLSFLLFHPAEFELELFPIYVLAAFIGGTFLTANSPLLRRILAGKKALGRATQNAAAATFLELGVSRTSARSGILVYLSLLEKRAAVVMDIGLDATLLGPDFEQQRRRIDEAMATLDPKTVLAAIESLAPYLERAYPRMADDVNELPDEVNSV